MSGFLQSRGARTHATVGGHQVMVKAPPTSGRNTTTVGRSSILKVARGRGQQ
jgi:hypothetical protein